MIRKSALFSLKYLFNVSKGTITYLKENHVIPFFYKALRDKDAEIREVNKNLIYFSTLPDSLNR